MAEKLEIIIQAKDKFSKTMNSLRGMLPSVKTLAIGAGAAVSALGAGLFAIANSTAKAGDEFQKMSLRLGLSTDMLSGMKHAVELSGASMQDLEKGVRTLAKRMSDADEGLVEAERSFTALGIQIKNTDGSLKDLDTMMAEAAQGLANMEDNTKRVAVAQEIFGRSGTALLPLFKQGAEGIRKMTEEAKELGITFDKTGADQAAEFRDNMLRLQRVFTGIKNQIGTALIPIFNDWGRVAAENGKKVIKYIKDNKEEIEKFTKDTAKNTLEIIEKIAVGTAGFVDKFRPIANKISDVLIDLWNIFTELPVWVQSVGIAGALLGGKKGLIVLGGSLHLYEALRNSIEGIAQAMQGNIKWSELSTMNAEELKAKLQELREKGIIPLRDDMSELGILKIPPPDTGEFESKIREFFENLKKSLKDIGAKGILPFDDDSTDKTKKNAAKTIDAMQSAIDSLHEMWNEYFLTEAERIDVWYLEQQEKYAGHREALNEVDEIYLAKQIELGLEQGQARIDAEKAANDRIKSERTQALQNLTNIGLLFGKKGLAISKAIAIPHAIIATHEAAISAYKAMAGIFLIGPALGVMAAAAAIAYGMKQVGLIKAQKAHIGLTRVPAEQAYVLARNERVVSGPQNEDLTRFLETNRESVIIEMHNIFHIFENATNVEAFQHMTKKDMQDICEDKFIPALKNLKLAGVTI